jgi:hypothetical protein
MSKGVESIRIKGRKIEDLPLGQGNEAKAQLPAAIETERLDNIAGINAKYPALRIDYIDSRVSECEQNITRIQGTMTQQATMISEYEGHIKMSDYRDKEIVKLEDKFMLDEITDETLKAEKKALFKRFLPFSIPAMEQQIVQCNEAIERCNDVIKKEHESIAEFTEARALCKQRDIELAQYGAVAEGS